MSIPKTSRRQSRHLPAFVLLALAQTPMHGGGVLTALNDCLPTLKADSAAVYRALMQLEKAGELKSAWDTSGRGPAIRVYRLTPRGWTKLDACLEDVKARLECLDHFVKTYEGVRGKAAPRRSKAGKLRVKVKSNFHAELVEA
ncbi:MAG: helix-turn-helix transcriptional regulator [Rhizomicrobium sp.]